MQRQARFFKNGLFGKEGPYPCYVIFDFKLFKVIRFITSWDGGAFETWRTRFKFYWSVIED